MTVEARIDYGYSVREEGPEFSVWKCLDISIVSFVYSQDHESPTFADTQKVRTPEWSSRKLSAQPHIRVRIYINVT